MPASVRESLVSVLTAAILPTCPKARKMLDVAGFEEATICASNDLDEYLIHDLKMQGAAIDSWGSEPI